MSANEASRPLPDRIIAWALQRKPVRAFFLYVEHRGLVLADSITYRTLFSVFAGVLLGFSVAALWLSGNPAAWNALIAAVNSAIPGLIGPKGEGVIDASLIEAPTGLTVAGAISLIGLVGAAIGAIGSLRAALRALADDVHDDVFWVWVLLRNFVLAVGIGGALAASAAVTFLATAGIGIVTGWLGIGADDPLARLVTQAVSVVVVFALDATAIAVLFLALSGVRPSARALWTGSLYGAAGLIVLQQLSSLFVRGASNNPLLASFGSLIALLLWLNLSAQVILLASAYIITSVEEEKDRVHARFGATTFGERRVQQAERGVRVANDELTQSRDALEKERAAAQEAAAKAEAKATAKAAAK